MARHARYTGKHPNAGTAHSLRALALDVLTWTCGLSVAYTLLSLDWTTF